MKLFINKNLDKALYESEYLKLLERESNYNEIEIDVEIGEEGSLRYITNEIYCSLKDVSSNPFDFNDVEEVLENISISYKLTESWDINFIFDIIEINKDNLKESMIKIKEICLI